MYICELEAFKGVVLVWAVVVPEVRRKEEFKVRLHRVGGKIPALCSSLQPSTLSSF